MTLDEIRARLVEIENELFGPDAYVNSNILGRPDPPAQLAREERREALRRERESLSAQLPPTGEASGQRLVMGRFLGTVILRETQFEEPAPKFDNSDPFARFAEEMGWPQ